MTGDMPTWTAPGGVRLRFRDVGSGPPLVLLHAFPLEGEMFEPQWTALEGRARFIVPDLRGFGGSGLAPGPSEMGAMADDVLGLLDHLQIDAAVVGGVSMGGYVSLALLRNDPARVKALVLADTQTSADDAPGLEGREKTAQQVLAGGSTALLPLVDRLLGAVRLARAADTRLGLDHRGLPRGSGRGAARDGAAARRPGHPRPVRRPGPGARGGRRCPHPAGEGAGNGRAGPGDGAGRASGAGHLANLEAGPRSTPRWVASSTGCSPGRVG